MVLFIRDNGSLTKSMEWAKRQMAEVTIRITKENSNMAPKLEKAFHMTMDNCIMKANTRTVINTDLENSEILRAALFMKDNGKMIGNVEWARRAMLMAFSMKGSGKTTSGTEEANTFSQTVLRVMVNTFAAKNMGFSNLVLQMETVSITKDGTWTSTPKPSSP